MEKRLNVEMLSRLVNDIPKDFTGKKTIFTDEIKKKIHERDNYKCQLCDQKGDVAHHIQPKGSGDIDNGITLCKECHTFVHYALSTYRGYKTMNPELFESLRPIHHLMVQMISQMDCTNDLNENIERMNKFLDDEYTRMDRREKEYSFLFAQYIRYLSTIEEMLLKIPRDVRKQYGIQHRNKDLQYSRILKEERDRLLPRL